MRTSATYCSQCAHAHPDTMKQPPWRWLCLMHPRLNEGFGFVTMFADADEIIVLLEKQVRER